MASGVSISPHSRSLFRSASTHPTAIGAKRPGVLAFTATAAIACFLVSLACCELVRRVAIQRALLDRANERSLHTTPTPRLGGVAIVVTSIGAGLLSWNTGSPKLHALVGVCFALALVGLRDDLRPLPAVLRLLVQIALAGVFLWLVGTPPLLLAPGITLPVPPMITNVLLVVWVVGVLNIYNFMDGMDGLAGSQAVSAAGTFAVVLVAATGGLSEFALFVGAASLGFLAHNAPPARMFMGDAGSTFLGMTFAALAILAMFEGVPIAQSALVIAPFLLDGTFTIIRRALRGERIWTAHRCHLYQRAVQTGLGHRDVLLVYLAWLGVCAAGALLASHGSGALAGAWAVALLGLLLVWRWVASRESERRDIA